MLEVAARRPGCVQRCPLKGFPHLLECHHIPLMTEVTGPPKGPVSRGRAHVHPGGTESRCFDQSQGALLFVKSDDSHGHFVVSRAQTSELTGRGGG